MSDRPPTLPGSCAPSCESEQLRTSVRGVHAPVHIWSPDRRKQRPSTSRTEEAGSSNLTALHACRERCRQLIHSADARGGGYGLLTQAEQGSASSNAGCASSDALGPVRGLDGRRRRTRHVVSLPSRWSPHLHR